MIDRILTVVSKTENCSLVNDLNSISNKALREFDKVLLIDTEISFPQGVRDIRLYVGFQKNLEIYLPKVFIDEGCYDQIKYIPHVNSDLSFCVIDESLNFSYDLNDIPAIVAYLIKSSKEILRRKYDVDYTLKEFTREFQAYWCISYSKKDKVLPIGLSLIDNKSSEEIRAIKIQPRLGQYTYVIYNSQQYLSMFERYLNENGIRHEEIAVFKFDFIKQSPPFEITYFESIEKIQEAIIKKKFKRAINTSKEKEVLCVFSNKKNEFYGWRYPNFNILPSGWRKKSNWEKLSISHAKKNSVERIIFSDFTEDRLYKRTAGEVIENEASVNVVGLGSVGSNLLHFLSKLPIRKYCLVDEDIFKVENLFRHNFNFSSMSTAKTEVAKKYLLDSNPYLEIITHQEDIVKVLDNEPDFFDQADYSFLIVGVCRIERYIIKKVLAQGCKKPLFVLWVEPYLASGQMMYITPDRFAEAQSILQNFPVKVLHEENESVFLKEGSCQSGYYPYSHSYLTMFLSAVFLPICDVMIKGNNNQSKIFSWVGDISYLKTKKLKINAEYEDNSFSLLVQEF